MTSRQGRGRSRPPKTSTTGQPMATHAPALSEVYRDLSDADQYRRAQLEKMVGGTYVWHCYEPRRGDNGDYAIILVENDQGEYAVVATSAYRVLQKLTQLAGTGNLPVLAKLTKNGNTYDLV